MELKTLCDIPFTELQCGHEVISARGNPGMIIRLRSEASKESRWDEISIRWKSGMISGLYHNHGHKVKIWWPQ